MKTTIPLLFLASSFLWAPLTCAGAEWHNNLPEAQQAAAEQGKDMLIVYQGDDLGIPGSGEAQLLVSAHFTDAAEKRHVLVAVPAPLERQPDGEEKRISCLVFADSAGRPYYAAQPEWDWGMDWLLEELAIAAERRAVVASIWQEMEERPSDVPEWQFASRLLAAMPVGMERFHAPYLRLCDEAARHGDHAIAERAARREQLVRRMDEMLREVLALGSFAEVTDYMRDHAEEMQQMPDFAQALQMSLASVAILNKLQRHPSAILTPEGAQEFQGGFRQIVNLEPRTKLARFIRTQGGHFIHAAAAGLMVAPTYKTNPQKALQDLDSLAACDQSFFVRQSVRMFRGRVLAELGQWDEALASLKEAVAANPRSKNARAAAKLAESILVNRERLDALLPLRRRGDEEVDAEWDALLAGEFDLTMPFCVSTDHELFYGLPSDGEEIDQPTAGAPELPDGQKTLSYTLFDVETPLPQRTLQEVALAAGQGDARAQKFMAGLALAENTPEGNARAAEWMRKAAEQGDAEAQAALGGYYQNGRGVEKDPEQAAQWLLRSAEQGFAFAQTAVGTLYERGLGVDIDAARAFEWYSKAAAQDDREGITLLAYCYADGKGVQADINRAIELFRKAAVRGCVGSRWALATLYYNGDRVPQDLMQAEYWFRKLAEQGDVDAMEVLQTMQAGQGAVPFSTPTPDPFGE